jgi:hypothetical protein
MLRGFHARPPRIQTSVLRFLRAAKGVSKIARNERLCESGTVYAQTKTAALHRLKCASS